MTTTIYTARRAALESKKKQLEAAHTTRLEELRKTRAAAQDEHTRAVEELDAEERATRDRLALELAASFYDRVDPIVHAWRAQPTRDLAAQFAKALADTDSACMESLGEEAWCGLPAIAMISPIVEENPAAAVAFYELTGTALELSAVCRKSIGSVSTMFDALSKLEVYVEDAVSREARAADDRCSRRFAVIRTCATDRDVHIKGGAFDAEEVRTQKAANAEAYETTQRAQPPKPRSIVEVVRNALF